MSLESLSQSGQRLLDRRSFLSRTTGALGSLPLLQLLSQDGLLAADGTGVAGDRTPIRPKIDPDRPYAARSATLIRLTTSPTWRDITEKNLRKHCPL